MVHRKQPTVALSSSEAEYRGADFATCEAIWLKQLLKEPHVEVADPTKIYFDNLNNISKCITNSCDSVFSMVKSN